MKKYRFRRKIIFLNLFIIIGLIMTLSFFAYFYLVSISNNNFRQQLSIESVGIATQIDSTMQMADEMALQLAVNNYIISIFQKIPNVLRDSNYFIDNPTIDTNVKKFLLSYMLKTNSIGRVCLFDKNKNFIFAGSAVDYGYVDKNCLDYSFMDHIQSYFKKSEKATLFEIYEQDPFSAEEGQVLSATREIKDYLVLPSEPVGYVQVQIPVKYFNKIFNTMNSSMEGYIINADTGNIIYENNQSDSGIDIVNKMNNNFKNAGKDIYIDNNVYAKVKELKQYHLRIIVLEKNDILVKYAVTTFIWMILLISGIVFVVLMGQIQIIKMTTKPIVELCEFVESIELNENLLDLPTIVSKEDDELRKLNNAFSGLLKNLKLSMDKHMASQINELHSHMYALQSQMNPHFIHNILTIISTMSSIEEYSKIPPVCERLSEMIRYSTTFDDSFISIDEEMNNTINYLELMKLRYEDKFQYNISYLSTDLEMMIPKFIFQPLVENCFSHGFKNKEFPWQLEIVLSVDETDWQIEIHDNGNGVPEEKLKNLLIECNNIKQKSFDEIVKDLRIGGLSLNNICARIYMAYGEQMVFELESEEKIGFIIRVGVKNYDTSYGD